MTRFIFIFIMGLLSLSSCTKINDIDLHDVSKLSISELSAEGVSGEVTLTITNRGRKVSLSDTQIEFFLENATTPLMTIIPEKITIPKGNQQTVLIPFNIQFNGGILGAIALPKLFNKQKEKINVSFHSKIKNGWASKKISVKRQQLPQLMNIIEIDETIFNKFTKQPTQ